MKKLLTFLALVICLAGITGFDGGDNVQLQQADISISSSGDNVVIPAYPGKQIVVYKMWFVTTGAVNVVYKHGSTAFNATAIHYTADGSSHTFLFDGKLYFGTATGEDFKMNLSGATPIGGQIYYALR